MTKRQLEKVRAKFENLDLSRYHILTYDEMLKVNGGGSVSDDSEDSETESASAAPESVDFSDSGNATAAETVSESVAESGGHEIENSNEAVANAEVGDTLTRNDGTEVTITQGDIDWAQDYCDAHGIDWSRSGEKEAKADDDAKEGGQAASAENQAELENYDFPDETNDNYSREKAEELKAEEENLQAASNEKGNASVSAESNKTSRNESKENAAVRREKAEHNLVDKFVGGAKNIFFDFFGFGRKTKDEAKIYVTNQTDVTILIRPEDSHFPYTLLRSGEFYYEKEDEKGKEKRGIDGVIFPDGTVAKTNGKLSYVATTDKKGHYVLRGGKAKDFAGNAYKIFNNIRRKDNSSIRKEDMYGSYSYADGSAPFLDDWLNSSKDLDIDNNHTLDIKNFVPIPRNIDGTLPSESDTLFRWNGFLQ